MNDSNNVNQSAPRAAAVGSSLAIPFAIVLGFGLIAAAIYLNESAPSPAANTPEANTQNLSSVAPVSESDHIRGNPNAQIVVVEYSDFDCPYCKSFHETMKQIIDEYGPDGRVAWVYRHFPLTSRHPSAAHIAEASECVASVGGNEAFWKFADLVFAERGTNEPTNVARLPEFAETSGVAKADYESCLESQRGRAKVEADLQNAIATGGTGTPHNIVIVGDQILPIEGAQPYAVVKQMIDGLLQ